MYRFHYYEPNLNVDGTVCWVKANPPRFSINFDSFAALRWSAAVTTSCNAFVCSAVKPEVSKAYQAWSWVDNAIIKVDFLDKLH